MKNLISLIFLPVLVLVFISCEDKTKPKKWVDLPVLTLDILSRHSKDTSKMYSDTVQIEFENGNDVVIIPPRTQCRVVADTAKNGVVVARVYFGTPENMKIKGNPFITYCAESGEPYLCTWPEHPDSLAFGPLDSPPVFYELKNGLNSRIVIDTAPLPPKNFYFAPGYPKVKEKKSPRA